MSSSKKDETEIIVESEYIINSSTQTLNKNSSIDKSKTTMTIMNNKSNNNESKYNYGIIEFIKIIGTHKYQAEFIKELKNFNLISLGADCKIILYNQNYKIIEEKKMEKWIYNITEADLNRSITEKEETLQILCNTKDEIKYLVNNQMNDIFYKNRYKIDSYISFNFQDDALLASKKGIFIEKNLFSTIQYKEFKEMQKKIEQKKNEEIYLHQLQNRPHPYPHPHPHPHFHPRPNFEPFSLKFDKHERKMHKFDNHSHFENQEDFYDEHGMFDENEMLEKFKMLEKSKKFDRHDKYNKYDKYEHQHRYINHSLHFYYDSLNEKEENKTFTNKSYKSGIQISNALYAFTSNRIDLNGEDNLLILNRIKKKNIYEVKNHSFILNPSNLCLISKSDDNKILLAACKKYQKGQKNGISLIKMDIKNEKFSNIFYDTGRFEAFCFCQILIITKTGYIFKNDVIITDTDYFLVGGFDPVKGKGIIKLFKIISKENFLDTKIEYIQDIIPSISHRFKGLKAPISSITQSKKTGDLLISCWDGNIYCFSPPDMEYFSFYDNQNNKKENN